MELIQIDTIKWTSTSYITTQIYSLPAAVFVDAETGVVYFNGMYPRYDANGRVMVIPRDQLPAIIAVAGHRLPPQRQTRSESAPSPSSDTHSRRAAPGKDLALSLTG